MINYRIPYYGSKGGTSVTELSICDGRQEKGQYKYAQHNSYEADMNVLDGLELTMSCFKEEFKRGKDLHHLARDKSPFEIPGTNDVMWSSLYILPVKATAMYSGVR